MKYLKNLWFEFKCILAIDDVSKDCRIIDLLCNRKLSQLKEIRDYIDALISCGYYKEG